MRICGIVAEYNPFHLGHARHIAETRRALGGETAIVCVMSGDFVQRGENAVFSKHSRAEAAVRCGADLVLELPLPWSLASAEGFARGAVGALVSAGVADTLSFGCESGALDPLERALDALEAPDFPALLRRELSAGAPFAAARQRAAEALAGEPLPALRRPNDLLAVEYLKALRALNSDLAPLAVRRAGAAHDSAERSALPAAAWLRQRLAAREDVGAYLPDAAAEIVRRETAQGRGPVLPGALETALLSRLRALEREDFSRLPDAGEGLDDRLYAAVRAAASLEEVYDRAKTKRYAHARLRRMCACAALGVRAEDAAGTPPWLRVLAASARGRDVLREMRARAAVPLLTRPAAVRSLDARSRRVFALGSAAADLLALGFTDPEARRCDLDYLRKPYISRESFEPGGNAE